MAKTERKYYRHSATGAVRQASNHLGYPYVELSAAEAKKLNIGGVDEPADVKEGANQDAKKS